MDSRVVSGVERNPASRFVDHTLATPWEQLSLDIEHSIKKLLIAKKSEEVEIDYLGKKYVVSLHESGTSHRPTSIPSRFSVQRYLFFRKSPTEWMDDTPSKRRTIFSAAATALQSSTASMKCDVPAFFVGSSLDVEESDEILGYLILRYNDSTTFLTNFEALTLPRVHSRHEMRYLDGLSRLFNKKMKLHNDGFNYDSRSCFARITETFRCADFETVYPFRTTGGYGDDTTPTFPTRRFISNEEAYHVPVESLELLENLWAPFNQQSRSARMTPNLLTEMTCRVSYPFMRRDSVVDSENSSSLSPSRQPPGCWAADASFAIAAFVLRDANSSFSRALFPLSRSLRRLTAFVIYANSCPKGMTIGHLSSDMGATYLRNQLFIEDKAGTIAATLSKQMRTAVSELCNGGKSSRRFRDIVDNQHETLLRILFRSDMSEAAASDDRAEPSSSSSSDGEADAPRVQRDIVLRTRTAARVNPSGTTSSGTGNRNCPAGDSGNRSGSSCNFSANVPALDNEWLSLCSMYAGSLDGGVTALADFWCACLSSFRESWEEARKPIPFVRGSSGWKVAGTMNGDDSDNDSGDSSAPLWQRSLWSDVQRRSAAEGWPFDLPDCFTSLMAQKLQMLQMCILAKDEVTTCCCPLATVTADGLSPSSDNSVDDRQSLFITLQRRVPLTEDALAQQEYISRKLQAGTGTDITAAIISEPEVADVAAGGDKRTTNNHSTLAARGQTLLQWQVKNAALVSDMKAWKALHPDGSCDDFCAWYTAGLSASAASKCKETWRELFSSCPSVPAAEQKPLFRAEAEAEKALDFFNSLSPVEVASELLATALTTTYFMLWHNINYWIGPECGLQGVDRAGDNTSASASALAEGTSASSDSFFKAVAASLEKDLSLLSSHIEEVVTQLRHDASLAASHGALGMTGGQAQAQSQKHSVAVDDDIDTDVDPMASTSASTGSRQVLVFADQIADMVERLEEFCEQALEVDDFLFGDCGAGVPCSSACRRRLVVALSRHGSVTAETVEEKRVLFDTAKLISRANNRKEASSAEVSSDIGADFGGRELGLPSERTIDIRYAVGVAGAQSQSQNRRSIEAMLQDSQPKPHRLFATVAGSTLRVSFSLSDAEVY